jgi:lysozyme family protein
MADPIVSINYVIRQEDSKMSGIVTETPGDLGGRTRFGISERWNPKAAADGFYAMDLTDALAYARTLYATEYSAKLQLACIANQAVANAMLSFAVNEGTDTSVGIAQKALSLPHDGILGPQTLTAINAAGAGFLVLLGRAQMAYYQRIVKNNPAQAKFMDGWTNRIEANCGKQSVESLESLSPTKVNL